jgi:hypothetical protein
VLSVIAAMTWVQLSSPISIMAAVKIDISRGVGGPAEPSRQGRELLGRRIEIDEIEPVAPALVLGEPGELERGRPVDLPMRHEDARTPGGLLPVRRPPDLLRPSAPALGGSFRAGPVPPPPILRRPRAKANRAETAR